MAVEFHFHQLRVLISIIHSVCWCAIWSNLPCSAWGWCCVAVFHNSTLNKPEMHEMQSKARMQEVDIPYYHVFIVNEYRIIINLRVFKLSLSDFGWSQLFRSDLVTTLTIRNYLSCTQVFGACGMSLTV